MKRSNWIIFFVAIFLSTAIFELQAQELFYNLSTVRKIETTNSKELKREATCWSNAGSVFLESELLRIGKDRLILSELSFVHSMYMKKADLYFKSDGNLRLDPAGTAYDVIVLAKEYGIVPDGEYYQPDADLTDSRHKEGEMNAIMRGTLNMAKQQDAGEFSEQWRNMYTTSLLRYLGEPKQSFNVDGKKHTPISLLETSGLNMDDYILITSKPGEKPNSIIKLQFDQNWADHSFFNVSQNDLPRIIDSSIDGGYTVLWYGAINPDNVFDKEKMAIIPKTTLPGAVKTTEVPEIVFEPIPEMEITDQMRTEAFGKSIKSEQDFLLIYGLKKDQNDKIYFTSQNVCSSENELLNLSQPFITLNTIYLLVNKNALPEDLKKAIQKM